MGRRFSTLTARTAVSQLRYSHRLQRIREDFGTTRADYSISTKDSAFAAYTVDDSYANSPSINPLSSIAEGLREQVVSAQEQHIFSSALLNTARVGYSRASYHFNGVVPEGLPGWIGGNPIGAIVIGGSTASNGASQITAAGTNTGSLNHTARNLFTYDDHVYWTHRTTRSKQEYGFNASSQTMIASSKMAKRHSAASPIS